MGDMGESEPLVTALHERETRHRDTEKRACDLVNLHYLQGEEYRVFGNEIILKWSRKISKSGFLQRNFTGTYLDLLITSESYCKDPTF